MASKLPLKAVVVPSRPTRVVQNSTALDVDTNSLNEKIREFERALKEKRFGVSARVPLEYHEPSGVRTELEFAKWDDEWRLLVVDSVEPPTEVRENKDILLNASREIRLLATQQFVALAGALVHEVAAERERVSKALAAADEAIAFVKSLSR